MATVGFLPEVDDQQVMVGVLGGFQVIWAARTIGLPKVSQRLLALLALRGRMMKRAAVAGVLWPDSLEGHAQCNLRSALSRLQGAARRAVTMTRMELGLAEGVAVDIRHAQALAQRLLDPSVTLGCAEMGASAMATLSTELLPDWYDDWVLAEAEDWRQLRLHALEALTRRLTADGRLGEAAGAARAAVRAEPLRESSHAALIQVHLAEGNQSEAVREFTHYRALLRAELGLEPTQRLYQLIDGLRSL